MSSAAKQWLVGIVGYGEVGKILAEDLRATARGVGEQERRILLALESRHDLVVADLHRRSQFRERIVVKAHGKLLLFRVDEIDWIESAGDYVKLNGTPMQNVLNPANNVANSTVSRNGLQVTDRSPAYPNQLGWDVDTFNADGVLANNATSATITLSV